MKYYTLRELGEKKVGLGLFNLNCNELYRLFPSVGKDEPISGEMLVNTLIESDIMSKKNALYKNHLYVDKITPDSVGADAYKKVLDFLEIKNGNLESFYSVYNAESSSNLAYAEQVKNCHWSIHIRNCNNVIFCKNVCNETCMVFNKKVEQDKFNYYVKMFGGKNSTESKRIAEEFFSEEKNSILDFIDQVRRKYEPR